MARFLKCGCSTKPKTLNPKDSNTRWLLFDSNELSDRKKLLLPEKQAENNFNISGEEGIAIADKLLENKCKSTKTTQISAIYGCASTTLGLFRPNKLLN